MNNNKPINLNTAIQQICERLNEISPSLRPRREHRLILHVTQEKLLHLVERFIVVVYDLNKSFFYYEVD
jgi:hypothetical protein